MIPAALVFDISCGKSRQTQTRHT